MWFQLLFKYYISCDRFSDSESFLIQLWESILKMEFVKDKWNHLVKAYKHYANPNDNPTDHDRRALELLGKG
jgi:hypothetical protein